MGRGGQDQLPEPVGARALSLQDLIDDAEARVKEVKGGFVFLNRVTDEDGTWLQVGAGSLRPDPKSGMTRVKIIDGPTWKIPPLSELAQRQDLPFPTVASFAGRRGKTEGSIAFDHSTVNLRLGLGRFTVPGVCW